MLYFLSFYLLIREWWGVGGERKREREREREGLLTVHTQTGDYTHTHLASKLPVSVTIQCFNQQNQTPQYLGVIVNRHVTLQK